MALAVLIGMLSSYIGLLLSYHRNLPSGPAIVMVAGACYGASVLVSSGAAALRTRLRGNIR